MRRSWTFCPEPLISFQLDHEEELLPSLDPNRLYSSLILKGPTEAIGSIDSTSEPKLLEIAPCTLALIYALGNRLSAAKAILGSIDADLMSAIEQSRRLEAELVLALERGEKSEHALDLASRALEMNPDAVFANRYVGHKLLKDGKFDEALERFSHVLRQYPEHSNSLLDSAAAFALSGRRPEGLDSLSRAPRSFRKAIYWLTLKSAGLGRIPFGLAIALPILFMPSPWPAFGVLSAIFLGTGICAFLRADPLVFPAAMLWEVQAILFVVLRLASGPVFKWIFPG